MEEMHLPCLNEFKSRDATLLENEFLGKVNIKNRSSLRELNVSELSSTSDVLVPSLLSGRDIRTWNYIIWM